MSIRHIEREVEDLDRLRPGEPCEPPPPPCGSEVRVRSSHLRLVGTAGSKLILSHSTPPYGLYLVPDFEGCPSLMTNVQWSELVRRGEAEVLPAFEKRVDAPNPVRKLIMQVDLLDAAGVANGAKAIAIWLHRNWTPDLVATWGPHDNVHTIRKWRAGNRTQRASTASKN